MSRRADALRAQQSISNWIEDLHSRQKTPHGLPEEVLVHALEGYGGGSLSWPSVRDKGINFRNYISKEVSDCTIRYAFRRPLGKKPPATSVSIFRLMANPL